LSKYHWWRGVQSHLDGFGDPSPLTTRALSKYRMHLRTRDLLVTADVLSRQLVYVS